jgi:hypothetical protein
MVAVNDMEHFGGEKMSEILKVMVLHFCLFNRSIYNNLSSLIYFPIRQVSCVPLRS